MPDENLESPEEKGAASLKWLTFFLLLVVGAQLGMWLGIDFFIQAPEQRGQFGDKFGAVNTFFSGLAFAGIIYTILLQRNELALQREELKETRQELKLSRLAHEKNSEIMDQQLQILRVTSKIENAEYRKGTLPQFFKRNVTVHQEDGQRKLWHLKLQNAGRDIKDATIITCCEDNTVGAETAEMPFIPGGNHNVWGFWAKFKTDGVYSFSIHFKSMDDQAWEMPFNLLFTGGVLEDISFSPAKERQ